MSKSLKGLGAQTFTKSYLDADFPELKKETKRNTRGNRSVHSPATIVHIRQSESAFPPSSGGTTPPDRYRISSDQPTPGAVVDVPRRTLSDGHGHQPASVPVSAGQSNTGKQETQEAVEMVLSHENGVEIGGRVRRGSVYKTRTPLVQKNIALEMRKVVSFSSFTTIVGTEGLSGSPVEEASLNLEPKKGLPRKS